MARLTKTAGAAAALCLLAACGGAPPPPPAPLPVELPPPAASPEQAKPAKQSPPPSAAPRDIRFPKIERSVTTQGLEINSVQLTQLPTVSIKLVIRSGSAADPGNRIGLAHLVSRMLKEGTKKLSSAQIAEKVDFLGARLSVHNDEENIYINMRALSEHFDEALRLVSDLAVRPRFSKGELAKLRKREIDRLALQNENPNFLVFREFFKHLYGDHPYANVDTSEKVVKLVREADLKKFHGQHFVPNNAVLVVVGSVDAETVKGSVDKAFRGWRKKKVKQTEYPAPPKPAGRQVLLIDRPESVQSVIFVGNLALPRKDDNYIPLLVANQVLGGSATSRLFMDLREKQSLTYGAYSRVYESVGIAPFRAYSAVRNEVTDQAMTAFMAHLDRIATEPTPAAELEAARRFLVDQFPLRIDTASKIAGLVSDLRIYGLPDDYWDSFASKISKVDADSALAAAKRYIRKDDSVIVVVGKAAAVKEALAKYGPVTVVDTKGEVVVQPTAETPTKPAAAKQAAPAGKAK